MKNTNLKPIMPFIPFVFYLIAISIGFNFQINSIISSEVNCLAADFCAQVSQKD